LFNGCALAREDVVGGVTSRILLSIAGYSSTIRFWKGGRQFDRSNRQEDRFIKIYQR